MAQIELSEEDRRRADVFLTTLLSEAIPDADFSEGSVLRDHTIAAVGAVFAFLRKEVTNVRNATSLRRVAQIEDDMEFTQAVDSIVSNWFVTRKEGRRVSGSLTLHFAQRSEGRIRTTTRFQKTAGLSFRVDSSSDWVYSPQDMRPQTTSTGEVTSYTLRIPVIAEHSGARYNIAAGPFAAASAFSPYFMFAENENAFLGAKDAETPQELLERVPDALTKRDLSSNKAIKAVLQDRFTDVSRVVVHGMGDPAMRRDLLNDPTAYYQIHLGGHTDVYISTPIATDKVFEGIVGEVFTDARDAVTLFQDPTVRDWREVVEVGDVIKVYNRYATEPSRYLIEEVTQYSLRVHERQPFPDVRPTEMREGDSFAAMMLSPTTLRSIPANFHDEDEGRYVRVIDTSTTLFTDHKISGVDAGANTVDVSGSTLPSGPGPYVIRLFKDLVEYSIGSNPPLHNDKVPRAFTGEFSNAFQRTGAILMPSEPVYRVKEVSLLDPSNAWADPITGRVTFPVRANTQPTATTIPQDVEFQLLNVYPSYAPSAQQTLILNVGSGVESDGTQGQLHYVLGSPDNYAEFTDPTASFNPLTDVGKTIFISNAFHEDNRGALRITTVDTTTKIRLERVAETGWIPVGEGNLHWEMTHTGKFDGKRIRVVYDSVRSFSAVDVFARARENHIMAANTLIKAFNPVYLSFTLSYRAKANAVRALDERAAIQHLVNYINAFPEDATINVSDIVSEFTTAHRDTVGYVQLPLRIDYTLIAPDGRRIFYETRDDIRITPANLSSVDPIYRLDDATSLGVLENTVRYLTDENLIELIQVF